MLNSVYEGVREVAKAPLNCHPGSESATAGAVDNLSSMRKPTDTFINDGGDAQAGCLELNPTASAAIVGQLPYWK